MKTIAIINESSVVTDAQLEPICQAIQVQVSRDFAPAWGIDAKIFQLWKDGCVDTEPPDGAWWLIVGDTSDELGALGYHDTTPEGLPLAKVFAKTDIEAKSSLSVTISHEVLERLLGHHNVLIRIFCGRHLLRRLRPDGAKHQHAEQGAHGQRRPVRGNLSHVGLLL